MPLTEAKRKANNKYSAAHYTVIGCKVRKEYAEEFRLACAEAGTTPNAVLKAAADKFLQEHQ